MPLSQAIKYRTMLLVLFCVAASFQAAASDKSNGQTGKSNSSIQTQGSIPPLAGALHVLPPLGRDRPSRNFDATLFTFLNVSICASSATGCQTVASFVGGSCTSPDGCIVLEFRDDDGRDADRDGDGRKDKRVPDLYRVDWKPSKSDVERDHDGKHHDGKGDDDDSYQIHFSVAGLEISFVSLRLHDRRELPILFSIDNHPRIRARVLHAQGQGATQIAAAIHKEFGLGGADTTAILLAEQFSDDDIGNALVAVFNPTALQVAQWMHDAGASPCDATKLLSDVFGANFSTLNADLIAAGYNANAVQVCLMRKAAVDFAPLIYLHPNEQFFPSKVEFAFSHETLNCYENGAPPQNLPTRSFPAMNLLDSGWTQQPDGSWVDGTSSNSTLPPPNIQANNTCYLTTNTPLSGPYDCNTPDGFQCSSPDLAFLFGDSAGVSGGTVPVYLSIYSLGPGAFNVEYKTFYPYNYGKKACTGLFGNGGCNDKVVQDDNHVGDWEGMSIQFVNFTVNAVRTAAHSTDTIGTTYVLDPRGTTYKSLVTDLVWSDSTGNIGLIGPTRTHPVVYAAVGSHGIWGDAGDSDGNHNYITLPTGEPLIDTTKAGTPWMTWKSIVVVSQDGVESQGVDQQWFGIYRGRWGNSEKIVPNNLSMCQQAANGLLNCVGVCTNDLITEFPLNPGPTTPPRFRDAPTPPNFTGTLPDRIVSLASLQSGSGLSPNACPTDTTLRGPGYGGPVIRLQNAQDLTSPTVLVSSPSGGSQFPDCEVENRAATFRIVPGFAPGGISIVSVSRDSASGSALHLSDPSVELLEVAPTPPPKLPDGVTVTPGFPAFAQSATFKAVPALASASGPSDFSLQAVYPSQGFNPYLRVLTAGAIGLAQAPPSSGGQEATFTLESRLTNYRPGQHWDNVDESPVTNSVRPGSQNAGTFIMWVRNHTLGGHHITVYRDEGDCSPPGGPLGDHLAAQGLVGGLEYGFTSTEFTFAEEYLVTEDDPGFRDATACKLFPLDLTALKILLDAALVLALDIIVPDLGTLVALGALAAGGYAAYLGITDPNQLNNDLNTLAACSGDAAKFVQSMFINGANSAGFITSAGASDLQDAIDNLVHLTTDDDHTVSLWRRLSDGSYCMAHQDGPC